ncbi:class I SAM-dependent methyltransferase [Brevundimonas sp.]|uniref:class I SAM-dependent methyltransferase n=1 Tax=Brevundimonas sp. TaxID=1871086 RepID=UPI00262BE73A|nr:class I SAM-dependent methyltransferase [Brevundimonas sp.]
MITETLPREITEGRVLYGDDFTPAQIAAWFEDERRGYFDIAENVDYAYAYHALNRFHGFNFLKGRYERCLAIGCAKGEEILPIADKVDEIVAIEPAEPWWSDRIGDTPAHYMAPSESGDIALEDGSVDVVTCFGVLHHIPNVRHVIGEIARVMKPGALFLLREPSSSMGDWRTPRPGMTRNERGIPRGWMLETARKLGLEVVRAAHCDFGPIAHVLAPLKVKPHDNMPVVVADAAVSALMGWNNRYWRRSVIEKIAPGSVFYVLRKPTA